MKPRTASRKFFALSSAIAALLASPAAQAAGVWDGDTTKFWNNPANWDSLPTSGTTTALTFNTAGTADPNQTNNDFSGTFQLNSMTFGVPMTVLGSQIEFAGTAPKLNISTGSSLVINNAVNFAVATTVGATTNVTNTSTVEFKGALSGSTLTYLNPGTTPSLTLKFSGTVANTINGFTWGNGTANVAKGKIQINMNDPFGGTGTNLKLDNSASPFAIEGLGSTSLAPRTIASGITGMRGNVTLTGTSMDFAGSFSTNDTSTTRTVTNDLTSGHTLTMASGTGSKFNITGPVIITSAVVDSRMVIPGEVFGTKAFGKTGTGTVVFTGTNTFSGVHTVAGGTLQYGKVASLVAASWTAAKINVKSGATLALNVGGTGEFTDANVDTLLTAVSVANTATEGLQSGAILGFDTTNATGGTFTQGNTIANSTGSGSFHGAIGVTKLGTGTLVLDKTNTYTGATTVNAGKLVVSGNISTSTLTTVAVGATLGGTGTVGKSIVNGTLAVGNSPGQMNFTDTLGLNGITVMEIDGTAGAGVAGGHDFANLTGAGAAGVLTYGGAMTLDIGTIFGVGTYSWNLFDMASETGTFNPGGVTLADQYSGSLLDGDLNGVWDLTSGSNTWQFTESTGVLGLTVVPEPSAAALLGGIGTLMLLRRRRA